MTHACSTSILNSIWETLACQDQKTVQFGGPESACSYMHGSAVIYRSRYISFIPDLRLKRRSPRWGPCKYHIGFLVCRPKPSLWPAKESIPHTSTIYIWGLRLYFHDNVQIRSKHWKSPGYIKVPGLLGR